METIIIYPQTPDKLQEIKEILKDLKIDFVVKPVEKPKDETAYLKASPKNEKRLDESIKNIKKGNTTKKGHQNIWK